jgi:hypothetical protein
MPDLEDNEEFDGQDLAETFDEVNITPDGEDIATSDMESDVFDVTSAPEDADLDDVLQPEDEADPDQMDEVEYEEVVMGEEDLDQPDTPKPDNAARVPDDDPEPRDFETEGLSQRDIAALGYDDAEADGPDPHIDALLDEGLAETFPASDPVSISHA